MPEGVGYGPQNTASTGLNLNVIGDHAYANSGTFGATTSEQTAFDFTTGSYLFVGKIQLNTFIQISNVTVKQAGCKITFNGVTVALLTSFDAEDSSSSQTQKLIIPPYTEVKVTVISSTTAASSLATLVMTGRIYK